MGDRKLYICERASLEGYQDGSGWDTGLSTCEVYLKPRRTFCKARRLGHRNSAESKTKFHSFDVFERTDPFP
jgi:hypothetical protein